MSDQSHSVEIKSLRLSDFFSPEQEAQLVKLLVNLITQKWGTLEIEIVKGRIRFFRSKISIEAAPPGVLFDL
jgi:hypothetical protein